MQCKMVTIVVSHLYEQPLFDYIDTFIIWTSMFHDRRKVDSSVLALPGEPGGKASHVPPH